MRSAVSTGITKILPSPIRPVCAAAGNRLDHAVGKRILHDHLELHLGKEVDDIFGPAIELGMTLLAAKALGFGDGDAGNAHFVQRASFTSSSLNGLMIASIFFTVSPRHMRAACPRVWQGSCQRRTRLVLWLHVPHRFEQVPYQMGSTPCGAGFGGRGERRCATATNRADRFVEPFRCDRVVPASVPGVRCMQPMPMDLPAELHRRASNLPDGDVIVATGPLVIMAHGLAGAGPRSAQGLLDP